VTVSLTKRSQSWFLSPLLATPVFLLNTYNNAVEGAVGIAPAVTHPDPEFISRYRKRWNVDPDDGAFFYYDAAAIAALAMADALRRHGAFPDRQQVTDSVLNVCSPRGVQIAWNEMEKGLDNIAAGKTIYYKGLTGPFLLDAFDNPGQQMAAPMKIWGIRDGVIVDHEKL
jgi:ABC-type branched-subunit amino acid transport system substrate-binding protein